MRSSKAFSIYMLPLAYVKDVSALTLSGNLNELAVKFLPYRYAARLVLMFFFLFFLSCGLVEIVAPLGFLGMVASAPLSFFLVNKEYSAAYKNFHDIYLRGKRAPGVIVERYILVYSRVGYYCRVDGIDNIVWIYPSRSYRRCRYRKGDRVFVYVSDSGRLGVIDDNDVKAKYFISNKRADI